MSCHEQKSFSDMVTDISSTTRENPYPHFSCVFLPGFRPSSQCQDAELFREKTEHESSWWGHWPCLWVVGQTGVPRCTILSFGAKKEVVVFHFKCASGVLFRKSLRKLVWQEATGSDSLSQGLLRRGQ